MAKSNRQKYNFLAAMCSQLDQARDEGDDLAAHFEQHVNELVARTYGGLNERLERIEQDLDSVNRGLAEVELAMEELDGDGRESPGEEPEPDYDGDDDDELAGVEPPLERPRERHGRVAGTVGDARRGQGERRAVTEPNRVKERIGRGTPA